MFFDVRCPNRRGDVKTTKLNIIRGMYLCTQVMIVLVMELYSYSHKNEK